MEICVYQYSTEDAYCEKLLLFFFLNLLLFLSLYRFCNGEVIYCCSLACEYHKNTTNSL